MKKIKKAIRILKMILFACMLATCMVMGIAIIRPKRKAQFADEVKMEDPEKAEEADGNGTLFQAET